MVVIICNKLPILNDSIMILSFFCIRQWKTRAPPLTMDINGLLQSLHSIFRHMTTLQSSQQNSCALLMFLSKNCLRCVDVKCLVEIQGNFVSFRPFLFSSRQWKTISKSHKILLST